MRVSPRGVCLVATTRTVSASMASSRDVAATTRPSALATTLLVTTTMSPSASPRLPSGQADGRAEVGEQGAEVVALADDPDAVDGDGLDPGHGRAGSPRATSRQASAMRAVASTSVIIVGTARQRMPAASTSSTQPASAVSTSHASMSPPSARAP